MHKKRRPLLIFLAVFFVIFFIVKTASLYPFLFHLVFDKGVNLKQENNVINILLLGIGGGTHEGTNLTDTIILASINTKDNKVILTSIPRDLWIPDLNEQNKKINAAYAYGEAIKIGGGLPLTKAVVGKITGQDINYALRIDFSGFIKAVDIVGGLDITVDNTFDDYQYPIDGKEDDLCGKTPEELQNIATESAELQVIDLPCRYKHLHFDKGLNHMDGQTALEYVRSRHAVGFEEGDFARSKRQEKVITAFKEKILSAQTFINPAKLISLYEVLKSSLDTDIKQDEFDDFVRLGQKTRGAKIQSAVIDAGDDQTKRSGLLIYAPITADYSNLSTLIPRIGNGNFSEIQKYITCEIKIGNCTVNFKY